MDGGGRGEKPVHDIVGLTAAIIDETPTLSMAQQIVLRVDTD